jgi:sulfur carrier protein
MQIVCNGEKMEVLSGLVLKRFIENLNFEPDSVVVECNGRIVKKDEYDTLQLSDNMVIELIRFVGGG